MSKFRAHYPTTYNSFDALDNFVLFTIEPGSRIKEVLFEKKINRFFSIDLQHRQVGYACNASAWNLYKNLPRVTRNIFMPGVQKYKIFFYIKIQEAYGESIFIVTFFLWKYEVFWDIPCIFMSRSVGPWYSIGEKFFGHKIVQLAILFYGICSALHCLKGRVTRLGKFACTLFLQQKTIKTFSKFFGHSKTVRGEGRVINCKDTYEF